MSFSLSYCSLDTGTQNCVSSPKWVKDGQKSKIIYFVRPFLNGKLDCQIYYSHLHIYFCNEKASCSVFKTTAPSAPPYRVTWSKRWISDVTGRVSMETPGQSSTAPDRSLWCSSNSGSAHSVETSIIYMTIIFL